MTIQLQSYLEGLSYQISPRHDQAPENSSPRPSLLQECQQVKSLTDTIPPGRITV